MGSGLLIRRLDAGRQWLRRRDCYRLSVRTASLLPLILATLTGCATIPKNIPKTCPDAARHADQARRHQSRGAVGLAIGIPLGLGAGALGGTALWASVEASTVNPTYVIIRPNGQRVNSAQYHGDLSTGLSIGGGVTAGFAVGLNIAGGVNLGLSGLQVRLSERDLDRCAEADEVVDTTEVIEQVLEGGAWLVLRSRVAYRIAPDSVPTAARWQQGERVLVRDGMLFNEARAEGVKTIAAEEEAKASAAP